MNILETECIVTIFGVSYSYTKPRNIDLRFEAEKYSRNGKQCTVTADGPDDIVNWIRKEKILKDDGLQKKINDIDPV